MRTRLGHVRANTRDLARAIDWYTTVLGYEVARLWPDDQPTYVEFARGDGAAFSLALDDRPSLGRCNFSCGDVDAMWSSLPKDVTVVEPLFDTPYGSRKFTIADPDGNELGFVRSEPCAETANLRTMLGGDFASLIRSGFVGLADDEYLWEPVSPCWSIRPREQCVNPYDHSHPGEWELDVIYPDPSPSPFTTIGWRIVHMISALHCGLAAASAWREPDGTLDARLPPVPRTAADATTAWNDSHARLRAAVEAVDDLDRTERFVWSGTSTVRGWVWFAFHENACHGAEVRLLRDLYRHSGGRL